MDSQEVLVVDVDYQLDSILEELGNFGKYQIQNYVWIVLAILLNASFGLTYIFTTGSTNHRCLITECDVSETIFYPLWLNHTIPSQDGIFESCKRFSATNYTNDNTCPSDLFDQDLVTDCDERIYEDYNTIIGEFDIGCEEWKRTLVGSLNNLAQLITMPITGHLSDRYGRKVLLMIALTCSGITGLIKSFSQNYWMFSSLEFIESLFASGIYSAAYILGVELVGPKYRVLGSTLISGFYAIGEVLLGTLAYFFSYWRTLIRITYIPLLFSFLYTWLVPESVRWLIAKGRKEEAADILKKAAKTNKVVLSEKALELLQSNSNVESKSDDKISYRSIFKSRIILVRIAVCSFWWITCTFVFYGLSLNSVDLAGDQYLNFILVSLIEIPAYVVYYFTVDRFGRKIMLASSFLGSGIACFAFAFVPSEISWLGLTLYLIGKFCITISFTTVYVYTTELFPTPLRNSLLAICSMFGRIGSIIAPQSPLLSSFYEPLPLLLFGSTSILSGLSIFFFPETLNIKLPDTIEEAENISK